MKEVLVIIENQKFFVCVRVYQYWEHFQSEQRPNIEKWKRIIKHMPVELQTQFISLLLAKAEEEGRITNWMYK